MNLTVILLRNIVIKSTGYYGNFTKELTICISYVIGLHSIHM